MKHRLLVSLVLGSSMAVLASSAPLSLHPQNPHYFLFRGKPTIILTSGEHYGAVLNLDFNYEKYLDALAHDGLNGTRTWSGSYCEPAEAFKIASNTLAPAAGRFVCPWARSDKPGYSNGGNKFDLTKWDSAYFKRLKDFIKQASRRGVVVEMNLFCPFYEESMWAISPMNAINNVNGVGALDRTNVYTLDRNDGLLAVQDAMVQQFVSELKDFDNLYYEICNEPYFGGVTLEWQGHIADTITRAESALGVRHLISRNVANDRAKVVDPHPALSIFNFHYATPPETVAMNYGLGKVIGDNETGFRGTNDSQYRMEGWDFIVAGGGLFNNLDYSFTAGHEDGTFVYPESQPGGGSPALRRQYGFLKDVLRRFDFIHMKPDNGIVTANLPGGASVRALAQTGKDYLVYIRTGLGEVKPGAKTKFSKGEVSLRIELPTGKYACEWLEPRTQSSLGVERFQQQGGQKVLAVPAFEDDIALTIRKR